MVERIEGLEMPLSWFLYVTRFTICGAVSPDVSQMRPASAFHGRHRCKRKSARIATAQPQRYHRLSAGHDGSSSATRQRSLRKFTRRFAMRACALSVIALLLGL